MKTAGSVISAGAILLALAVSHVHGSGTISVDGDFRAVLDEAGEASAEVHVVGVSLRKIFSDSSGDRWLMSGLVEFHDDLSERMLHETYIRYKGPMGRWNITTGRFQLPFSLLSGFSTTRLLYESLTPITAGLDADGGIMISGVTGDVEYGIAASQGLGVHDDPELHDLNLLSGRVAWTYGDAGEISVGVSAMIGHTRNGHSHSNVDRRIIGMDGTVISGVWITRWEIQTGTLDSDPFAGGFIMADYGVLPRLDLTGAARLMHATHETTGSLYLGIGYRSPWCIVRGGYRYDISETDNSHGVSIQLYRLVSLPF